jgi:hypothetical protein|tara:strand:- start:2628 stop:2771 length:144 start_codon:yes stop_codon:yes gene_type:complete
MEYPNSELEYWAAFFSIDDNNDRPSLTPSNKNVTVEQSIADLKKVLN